ncbi:stage III sporulation protein AG [Clostridium paraputrificum]|uniref:stage III sporulation protein AG n=1 Tax=Clostridium paraputrificum TaxID=29363 RepID=UPI003D33392F
MDKEKIKKELAKLFSDKKMANLISIVLVLVFILLAINIFMPNLIGGKSKELTKTTVTEENKEVTTEASKYEESQKIELTRILKKIQGVGEVDVLITCESGEVKVPATDSNTQTTTTEETDKGGGKRINKQNNGGTTVVMTSDGSSNEPFITQVNKPKVIGVFIAAEGAEVSKVRADIEKAVSNLYNLSADKVNVYPMK